MREFINAATNSSGGVALAGSATGQLIIAASGLFFMILFGSIGTWLKWKDSKAIREAIDSGDIKEALRIRSK